MIEELLKDVKEIITENENEINKTGKGFNLISILGMEENERYTHSAIIAELFNRKGSHTFGNKFFKLFLEQVEVSDFNSSNYEVITEEYFSDVKCGNDELMRTFLDIVIKDKSGKVILIENKIWAKDQFEQLERYYECYKDNIVKLFYLNVHHYDYSFSLKKLERDLELDDVKSKEILKIKEVYQSISYEIVIKNWLANCIVASSEKPYVSKQIEAYYQTILKISKQDIYKKMSTEIERKLTESIENFKVATDISSFLTDLKNEKIQEFKTKVKNSFKSGEIQIKEGKLTYKVEEDGSDFIFLGFNLMDENNLSHEVLKNKLSTIFGGKNNNNFIGWVNSIDINNPEDMFRLCNDVNSVVQETILKFQFKIEEIKTKLQE